MKKHQCPPTPSFLQPHFLKALARSTQFQPNKFISCKIVKPDILSSAGFDPKELGKASKGWNLKLTHAFQRLQKAKLAKPGKMHGTWGLTKAGVDAAAALDSAPKDTKEAPSVPTEALPPATPAVEATPAPVAATEPTPEPTPKPKAEKKAKVKAEKKPKEPKAPSAAVAFSMQLLGTLGKTVKFVPDTFVPCKTVKPDVLTAVGLDPKELEDPDKGWSLKFTHAFQRLQRLNFAKSGKEHGTWGLTKAGADEAHNACKDTPDGNKGSSGSSQSGTPSGDGEPTPPPSEPSQQAKAFDLDKEIARLTAERDRYVRELEKIDNQRKKLLDIQTMRDSVANTKTNITTKFLDTLLHPNGRRNDALWNTLRNAVSHKLPMSAKTDIIDDHIQNCLLKIMARDSFRERLLAGIIPTASHLASYAVNAGYTDVRDSGKEPVARAQCGAQTTSERKNGIKPALPSSLRSIPIHKSDGHLMDVDFTNDAHSPEGEILRKLSFDEFWEQVKAIIKKRKTADRDLRVLRMKIEGHTAKDIAAVEKIKPIQVNSIILKAEKYIRQSPLSGEFQTWMVP